jgi:hypothetical protein
MDVKIGGDGELPPAPTPDPDEEPEVDPFPEPEPEPSPDPSPDSKACRAIGEWAGLTDEWCNVNCNYAVRFCPASHCICGDAGDGDAPLPEDPGRLEPGPKPTPTDPAPDPPAPDPTEAPTASPTEPGAPSSPPTAAPTATPIEVTDPVVYSDSVAVMYAARAKRARTSCCARATRAQTRFARAKKVLGSASTAEAQEPALLRERKQGSLARRRVLGPAPTAEAQEPALLSLASRAQTRFARANKVRFHRRGARTGSSFPRFACTASFLPLTLRAGTSWHGELTPATCRWLTSTGAS